MGSCLSRKCDATVAQQAYERDLTRNARLRVLWTEVTRGRTVQVIPFDMFELDWNPAELRRLQKTAAIYHRGQTLAWNGHETLDELFARHGVTALSAAERAAMQRIVGQLMWGELIAWRTAAQLADELVPLEAKMAATAQAHDEARHFYVFHEYLERMVGGIPHELSRPAEKVLKLALSANSIAKKVLAMQLQVESVALTTFHALREAELCPVLSELLVYYEKDEARHVGLGVQLLPILLRSMNKLQLAELTIHTIHLLYWSLYTLKDAEGDLLLLGVKPRRVAELGRAKRQLIFNQMLQGLDVAAMTDRSKLIDRAFDAACEWLWPASDASTRTTSLRLRNAWHVLRHGAPTLDIDLGPES